MGDRTIRVQGLGRVTTDPDRVVLTFGVTATDEQYGASIEKLNLLVEDLRNRMEGVGVERRDLTSSDFSVSPRYEKEKIYPRERRVLVGYEASHRLRLEMPIDRERLNEVLQVVSESRSAPRVSISFATSDEEGLRLRAIEAAVEQASRNAESIAKAAGLKLKEIQDIEYGWSEVRIHRYAYALEARMADEGPASAPDIEPGELTASESVTVRWRVE